MDLSRVAVGLGIATTLAFLALWSVPAVALDDELENPYACTNPFGGSDSREGTVITVPGGWPMPTGTPPPPPSGIIGAPYPPPLTTYVCSNGGWVPVSSALEVGLRVDPDSPTVTVDEGSPAVMTGSYVYAGDTAVDLTASVGQVSGGGGAWTWTSTPDDGPDTRSVTVTATAGEESASATFDLVVDNVPPTVTSIEPATPVALVGQQVAFVGSATDPSVADTAAGFTWGYQPDPPVFSSCGSHTVTGRATDADGGVSPPATSAPVEVVEAAYTPPLAAGVHNMVRAGQVVPVRVAFGCDGGSVTGLAPRIQLVSGDLDPSTTALDPDLVVPATDARGDSTGLMRETASGYLYNLQVPRAPRGSLFTVRVSPGQGGGAAYAVLEVR